MTARPAAEVWVVLAVAIAALCIAGYATWLEARPYLNRGSDEAETIALLESGRLTPALSQQSHQLVAGDCLNVISSLYLRTRKLAERQALLEACRTLVARSVESMPSFSFGWYAVATSNALLDDFDAFNHALMMSQATGRSEQWIGEMRVALAESEFDHLTPDTLAGEEHDLGMLVLSWRGVSHIAKRYVDDPAFRERITRIVEVLPPDAQARFVNYVRMAAAQ